MRLTQIILNPADPKREMKIENVSGLEASMCIDYFKYERLREIDYSFKEIISHSLGCSSNSIKENFEVLKLAKKNYIEN